MVIPNSLFRKPVINVEAINAQLFAASPELAVVRALRLRVAAAKRYLVVCRLAQEAKLLKSAFRGDRQHFVDGPDLYSMKDLHDAHSGELADFLADIVALFAAHIRDCVLCAAKGFHCEACDERTEVLFPFDEDASACAVCGWVFHRNCFKAYEEDCPRCVRKGKKRAIA